MWKLIYPNGNIFREGFPTQWEALRSSVRADGSYFKKVDAVKIPSGTVVYKNYYIQAAISHSKIKDDGTLGDNYVRKVTAPTLQKFILLEY